MRELRMDHGSKQIERIISINRVTKVTKGGKKQHFSALVVVGDGKGRVSFALGKANDVANAIRKALSRASKEYFSVPLKDSTIPHQVIGKFGAAKVLLKPASEGTGVIAAGPVRAFCEAAGIRDILTKCLESNNPINVIRATAEGLKRLKSAPTKAQPEDQAPAEHPQTTVETKDIEQK